jgi:predicted NBD/HSP70 family sugar kinase
MLPPQPERMLLLQSFGNGAMESLGEAVTNVVNILEPEVVVLGGGVTRSGKVLENSAKNGIVHGYAPIPRTCSIELAQRGQASSVAGAGALALDLLANMSSMSSESIGVHAEAAAIRAT